MVFLGLLMALALAQPTRLSEFHVKLKGADLEVSIQFFDRLRGDPPRFISNETCVTASGDACRPEPGTFVGACAIVHFEVRSAKLLKLRERVRLIDQDEHLPHQATFEKTVSLIDGIGSDIQLFGYRENTRVAGDDRSWRFLRQELYLGDDPTPSLILHWKHTITEITLIDAISEGAL